MAASIYDAALARVLAHEGGYVNHPADPGGPTNFGITIADYRRYAKPGATAADVRAMPLDAAKAIYHAKYWDALRGDALPAGLDYAIFDYGVNSGVARAAAVLQEVSGCADGGRRIDDALLEAIAVREPKTLIVALCDERLAFLRRLKTWPVFGDGWGRRVAEVKAAALAWATGALPDGPTRRASGKGMPPAAAVDPHAIHNLHWLQQTLNALGASPRIAEDGQDGPRTRAAVAEFQRRHGLAPDGIAGARTAAALQTALSAASGIASA